MTAAWLEKLNKLHPKRKAMYAGVEDLDEMSRLFENAGKIVDRIRVSQQVLDYLYEKSRYKYLLKDEWEKEVRFAIAIDSILLDFLFGVPLESLSRLTDQTAKAETIERLKSSKGMLLLGFHGGFRMPLLRSFEDLFKDGLMIRRGAGITSRRGDADPLSAMNNPGEALFVAMRALLEGRQVLLAPDGPFGRQKTTITVLNVTCPIAMGAAFLAYETKCETAWFTVARSKTGFAPVAERGPSCEGNESFAEYRDRLHRFYAEKIELSFTGDPQNLPLSGRWLQYFLRTLAASSP